MENISWTNIITNIVVVIFMFVNSWWNRKRTLDNNHKDHIKTEKPKRKISSWMIVNGFLILILVLNIYNLIRDLINDSLSKQLIFSVSMSLTFIIFITFLLFDRIKSKIYMKMFHEMAKEIDKLQKLNKIN